MTATIRPFELLLASPLATASGTIDARDGFLFDVADTGDTQRGLGEACPLYPFTETKTDCHDTLQRAAAAFEERDSWRAALEVVSETRDGRLRYPAARHAVSLALLDRAARRAGVPLYRHLGGTEAHDTVAVNATIGDISAEDTVEEGVAAVEDEFQAIKVKVGDRAVEADAERIDRLRSAVGDEIAIRVDANGAWSPPEAKSFIAETTGLGLDYVEQPLAPDDLAGHASLRGRGVDIALDESVAMTRPGDIIEANAADVFVLKPMAVGGIDVARGLVLQVRRHGHRAVFSNTIDSVVARTAAIHAAASLPEMPPSGLATGGFLAADLAPDPAPVRHGTIHLPQWPGLGIDEVQT